MGDRSLSSAVTGKKPIHSLTLTEVCDLAPDRLEKSCKDANLIVVHSRELDDAGEANVGLASFETYLQQIKSAWSRLKNIGISEFVFTADHGFLLRDETTQVEKIYGSKRDPARRYVLSSDPRSEDEMTTVSLSALKYEGQEGYLLFRKDTAVFATGNPGATFVHGGNSLQERVIPVLMVSHRHQSSLAMVNYFIEVEPQPDLLGFSRIRVKVKPVPDAQSVLSFGRAKAISLALRVRDRADIQITIKDAPGAEVKNQQIQAPVDADWTELLFDLQGPRDERVQLEIFHPDGIETVASATTTQFFNVSGSLQGKTDPNIDSRSTIDWQTNFEDESIRNVFLHLQQHGSITEPELIQMLGNARHARRFALQFEEHLKKVPFSVRIETTSSGKLYVKQNQIN